VVNVIDGDTVQVEMEGRIYPVRYTGIDCPEFGEYGYEQATRANRQLVQGKTVRLVKDVSDTDQYGRLLRYVYVGDTLVNAELVRRGLANALTCPPDVAYSGLLVQLEREARAAGRGLWAAPTPTSGVG
jgi:micrococcal nuclease